MEKKMILCTSILAASLLFTGCGNGEKALDTTEGGNTQAAKTEEPSKVAAPEQLITKANINTNANAAPAAGASSGEVLNPTIAEESKGKVEVIYTNKEPKYSHDMKGFKVTVNEYQIVKVTGMNKDVTIPFNDQTDGYVVTARVTLDNATGKAMYYNNNYRIQVSNEFDYIPSDGNKTFVKKEDQVKSKIETETSKYAAGEKVTGLVTFTLTNAEFESLKKVKPKFIIEGGAADNNGFKESFKGNATFEFAYSDEQKQQTAGQASFYPDRLTTDNLADKKMIFEKSGINETKQLGEVKVTLDGVQYAEVIPTEANKERFRNFGDSGLVALTVKLKVDNQSGAPVSIYNLGSKLRIDDTRGTALSEGMAEPRDPQEIQAGQQGEKYHVFLFRKDEFELFKKFELEFGPFYGADGKGLFNNATVKFTLPR